MNLKQESTIVAVTGTKGKTSVVRTLHFVVNALSNSPVLRVDTSSVVVGTEKKFGLNDSWRNAGFVPTVCPGRFLVLLGGQTNQTAILEAAVGSSRVGLGYRSHNVGVFTNVYDDHVGMKEYLASREDLADAKASFIFGKIRKNGAAVFNVDEPLIVERLNQMPEDRSIYRIACSLKGEIGKPKYDAVVFSQGAAIILEETEGYTARVVIADYPWLLGGKHTPTIYNMLSVIGALWGLYRKSPKVFERALEILKTYSFDPEGGRLVTYLTPKGVRVLIDFAHEKESLRYIAEYARSLAPSGRVYGVVRLDGSRPAAHIDTTGHYIAPYYDELFVYDKEASNGKESDGSAAKLFAKSLSSAGTSATFYATDTEALEFAKSKARQGDAIVYIISSFDKGLGFVKNIFEGEDTI